MHTMRSLVRSAHSAPALGFIPALWRRVLQPMRLVVNELHRSLAASRRYEELRTVSVTASPLRGRGSNARQVFIEIYADAAMEAPYTATPAFALLAPGRSTPVTSKTLPVLFVLVLVLALTIASEANAAASQVRPGAGSSVDATQAEHYEGSKARIAVADFEDKMSSSGQYRAEYGRGMADMLATALFNSNRYIVLERQKLAFVLAEQDLGASGRIRRQTAAPIGELEGAELLVVGAVTGFDPGVSGGGGNLGGALGGLFGKGGAAIGSLAGGVRTAHIAIDVRVIDTKTGRVVAANSVQGSASEFSGSLGVASTKFSAALGGFSKTPMEKAIRDVIETSVNFVASKTPRQYFRAAATGAAPPVPELQPAFQREAGQAAPVQQAGGQMAPSPEAARGPTVVASIPQQSTSASQPVPKSIAADKNPKLTAELTEVRKRGAVVSVVVTVRNTAGTNERLEYQQQGTHLLDYAEGKKYELVSGIQGNRSAMLGPNEQTIIRAMFKAPPQAQSVAVVIEELGTFDDVALQ